MPKYWILIKKTGAKRFMGAFPGRKGISKTHLLSAAKRQIKKGFSFKIITESELGKKFSNLIKRRLTKKKRIRKGKSGGKRKKSRKRRLKRSKKKRK